MLPRDRMSPYLFNQPDLNKTRDRTTYVQALPPTPLRRLTTTPNKPKPASSIASASGSGTGVIASTARVALLGAKSLIWLLLPLPTRGHRFHWYWSNLKTPLLGRADAATVTVMLLQARHRAGRERRCSGKQVDGAATKIVERDDGVELHARTNRRGAAVEACGAGATVNAPDVLGQVGGADRRAHGGAEGEGGRSLIENAVGEQHINVTRMWPGISGDEIALRVGDAE